MADITADLVKELRDRTGAGFMDCKRALTEADGDLDKATAFLREQDRRREGRSNRQGSRGEELAALDRRWRGVGIVAHVLS